MKKITTLAAVVLALLLPACATVTDKIQQGAESISTSLKNTRENDDNISKVKEAEKQEFLKAHEEAWTRWEANRAGKLEDSKRTEANYRRNGRINEANAIAASRDKAEAFARQNPGPTQVRCTCQATAGDPYACTTAAEVQACTAPADKSVVRRVK